mmetsp:Transcript_64908/g.107735  ORF Transcript_64908/g.107735 Transcript_64908/m.107735 type:complete len:374 (+) Transcript_64908:2839-3960(+)
MKMYQANGVVVGRMDNGMLDVFEQNVCVLPLTHKPHAFLVALQCAGGLAPFGRLHLVFPQFGTGHAAVNPKCVLLDQTLCLFLPEVECLQPFDRCGHLCNSLIGLLGLAGVHTVRQLLDKGGAGEQRPGDVGLLPAAGNLEIEPQVNVLPLFALRHVLHGADVERDQRLPQRDEQCFLLLVQKHAPHLRHVLLRGVADQLAACQFAGGAIILLLIVLSAAAPTAVFALFFQDLPLCQVPGLSIGLDLPLIVPQLLSPPRSLLLFVVAAALILLCIVLGHSVRHVLEMRRGLCQHLHMHVINWILQHQDSVGDNHTDIFPLRVLMLDLYVFKTSDHNQSHVRFHWPLICGTDLAIHIPHSESNSVPQLRQQFGR